jgi:hypothetical protein
MKRKLLIGVAAVVVVVGAGLAFLSNRNRTLSPPGKAEFSQNDFSVSVNYSRPSVRGRVIFGTKEQGALQPYGEYWRLGANESTEITFNKGVLFNNQPLKAGTYRVYAYPGAEEFEIVVNTQLGRWGAFKPDKTLDIMRTKIPVAATENLVEQYTISIVSAEGGADVIFEWANTKLVLPLRVQ